MGIKYSANPVASGLVFAWDKDNQKSYKGPAIQNLSTSVTANPYSGSNISMLAGSANVKIPGVGYMSSVAYIDGYNSNSASYCCPHPFYFVTGDGYVACSGSTAYTYAILYKCASGYTSTNYMYRVEYTSGGAYVTEGGVHNDSNRVHLGDGWYWAWGTFTTQATTARLYLQCYYYQYNVSDRLYVAKVMVTPGDYTGLHPRLWPSLGTSESITSRNYDALNAYTFSAGSMTYDSSGNPSFNGSSNYLKLNTLGSWPKQGTIEYWFKPSNVANYQNPLHTHFQGSNIGIRFEMSGSTNIGVIVGNDAGTNAGYYISTSISSGNWYHIVVTWDVGSNLLNAYINGTQTITNQSHTYWATTLPSLTIGNGFSSSSERWFSGSISTARVYTRVLSAAEVLQNYRALKGRYGL